MVGIKGAKRLSYEELLLVNNYLRDRLAADRENPPTKEQLLDDCKAHVGPWVSLNGMLRVAASVGTPLVKKKKSEAGVGLFLARQIQYLHAAIGSQPPSSLLQYTSGQGIAPHYVDELRDLLLSLEKSRHAG